MRTILLFVALIAIYIVATPTNANPISDINDPHIQELGRWAVTEHVKQANDGIKFKKVVSGDIEKLDTLTITEHVKDANDRIKSNKMESVGNMLFGGTIYRLIIDASNSDGKHAKYKAELHERDWRDKLTLLSFEPTN